MGDKDTVFAVVTPSVGPVHVVAVTRGIVEDVALALINLPVGDEAVAVGIHSSKAHGYLAGRQSTVPHAHLTQSALEELATAVIAP